MPPLSRLILEMVPLNFGESLDVKVRLFVVAIPTLPLIVTLMSG